MPRHFHPGGTETPEASFLVRRDGSISEWGPGLENLTGWLEAAARGRPFASVVVPLDPPEMPELRAFVSGMSWSGLVAVPGADGAAPRLLSAEARRASGGDDVRVTLRRRSEARATPVTDPVTAAQSHVDRQRFDLLVEYMPGFVYTLDRDLNFTSSVGAGLPLLNLGQNELVGVNLLELWGVRDPTYEPLACHLRCLAGSTKETYRDVCVGRSIEYRLRPIHDLEGNVVGIVSAGFDVTEREHAREEQAKLTAQLRQAQKMEAIGRLAGGVAHDFNNLLTCIMGNLTLAEEQVEGDTRLARFIDGASAAAESAATLTRQLLAFGRKQVIEPRPVNLSSLIERVKGMLERLIGESITLETACPGDLWYVQADPGQLEQVLVNLVVNARDAITGHGSVTVETRNVETSQPDAPLGPPQPGRYVMLSVSDTGRGMSDVVRSKLFEPFFTTKETGAGTGLGLATVYGAVQQNGGTITVESTLGQGSTFRIFLPRVEPDTASLPSQEAAPMPPSSRTRGGTETILLVEDEPLVLDLAACTLEQLGYNVLPCASADEALRRLPEYSNRIDLLVTDVVMPRMNGKELASRVASLQPSIAVLFSSGYGEDIIAKQGVLDAGLYFIGKPYRPGELAAKVRGILDERAERHAAVVAGIRGATPSA
ncbi:MAG TPA: ATP-binding protein [Polyangiaceae bacterium]|nr:ATP-binding protein [Polyangiaceae bacterium]